MVVDRIIVIVIDTGTFSVAENFDCLAVLNKPEAALIVEW